MSDQLTLWDTPNVTSSPGSEDGRTLSDSQAGPTPGPCGQDRALASLSARQALERGLMTRDTYGHTSDGSLTNADLSPSLASRLRARMGVNGSPEYVLTWTYWDMPQGPPIYALLASGRRTNGSGYFGLELEKPTRIRLSNGSECLVSPEDYSHISQWKWGINSKGYPCRNTRQGKVLMHRYIIGAKKGEIVDHIDGDTLNNQRENLRLVTASENNHNRRNNKNVRKPKGRNRWVAQIWKDGKYHWLGSFNTRAEAMNARLEAEQRLNPAGWPTPDSYERGGAQHPEKRKAGGHQVSSQDAAVGWASPSATDGKGSSEPGQRRGQLSEHALLAGWPTAKRDDGVKSIRTPEGALKEAERKGANDLNTAAVLAGWATPAALEPGGTPEQVSGTTTYGSNAKPEKRGALNPALARWLMAYPVGWCQAAIAASRKRTIQPKRG